MEKTSRPRWRGLMPEGTRSFAIVMEDSDSSRGAFTHWLLHDTSAASADIEIQQDDDDHIDWKIADAGGREAPLARCNDSLLIQSWIE